MGVCTKRSALLASDQTDSSSSRSPSVVIHQLANLDFFAPANPSMDWNLVCLGFLDLASCEGCYNSCHSDILVESRSIGLFVDLLLEVSDCRHKDLYISTDPLNWWCYFLSRRRYVAWCAKINHLVLTLPRRLLHMLHWWSRIILCLIRSSTLSLFKWTLNCLDIIITSWCCFLMTSTNLISPLGR